MAIVLRFLLIVELLPVRQFEMPAQNRVTFRIITKSFILEVANKCYRITAYALPGPIRD